MRVLSSIELDKVSGAGPIDVVIVSGTRPIGSSYSEPGEDFSQFTLDDTSMEASTGGTTISSVTYNGTKLTAMPAIMCAIAVEKARRNPTYTNVGIAANLCGDAFTQYMSAVDWRQLLDYVHYPMAGHVD